jgi:site-specific recombinase XerD
MRRINPANEKAKRDYLLWLGATGRKSRATLDQVAAAIDSFAGSTRHADFRTFRPEQAMSYKERLAEQINPATAKPLAKATLHGRLSALKAFFEWLCREPGYRRIRYSDAAYFNLTANEARIATAAREQKTPSLEQVLAVLEAMPADTIVQRRDRALIAFILLTGVRNNAAITLRLKHVDFARGQVSQDAREVRTKGAKTVESVFFPVGEVPHRIVGDWIAELTGTLLFGPDDALFPAARIGLDGEGRFLHPPHTVDSVYECSLASGCGLECRNRLVQRGPTYRLEVIRCMEAKGKFVKGWGVRSPDFIPKGAFICEYIGEYISDDEAESRGIRYDNQHMSRLMDVVGDGRDVVRMCIDATRFSNLGRFLNHSCDPNCFKQRVFCDHNSRLPRIAFFALRDIPPLEELGYDYGYQDVPGKTFPCLCGAWNCKKLLY